MADVLSATKLLVFCVSGSDLMSHDYFFYWKLQRLCSHHCTLLLELFSLFFYEIFVYPKPCLNSGFFHPHTSLTFLEIQLVLSPCLRVHPFLSLKLFLLKASSLPFLFRYYVCFPFLFILHLTFFVVLNYECDEWMFTVKFGKQDKFDFT